MGEENGESTLRKGDDHPSYTSYNHGCNLSKLVQHPSISWLPSSWRWCLVVFRCRIVSLVLSTRVGVKSPNHESKPPTKGCLKTGGSPLGMWVPSKGTSRSVSGL